MVSVRHRLPNHVYTLEEIRERHHSMAKMVAAGMGNEGIAQILECSVALVANMRGDPTFAALAESYRTGEPMFTLPGRMQFRRRGTPDG